MPTYTSKIPKIFSNESEYNLISIEQTYLLKMSQKNQTIAYNNSILLHFEGNLDTSKFIASLRKVIDRNTILRSYYIINQDTPDNFTHNISSIEQISDSQILQQDDLSIVDEQAYKKMLDKIKQLNQQPIDITSPLLFNSVLFKLSENNFYWSFNIHKSIFDSYSADFFCHELCQTYNMLCQNKILNLNLPALHYLDYVTWQKQQPTYWFDRKLEELERELENKLGFEIIPDYTRTNGSMVYLEEVAIDIDKETYHKLAILSQNYGVSIYVTLLAAFNCLMYIYTGETDITLGTIANNRERNKKQLQGIIGNFANYILLPGDLSNQPTFSKLLNQFELMVKQAHENSNVPFEDVANKLKFSTDSNRTSLFKIMFCFEEKDLGKWDFSDVSCTLIPQKTLSENIDFCLTTFKTDTELSAKISYNPNLFKKATIENLARHFQILLADIVKSPDRSIDDLSVISKEITSPDEILWRKIHVTKSYPELDKCLHELIEEEAKKNPENIAIIFDSNDNNPYLLISYQNLIKDMDNLCLKILALRLPEQSKIGICVSRSIEYAIVILALSKIRMIAVPLETELKDIAKIDYKIRNSKVICLVFQSNISEIDSIVDRLDIKCKLDINSSETIDDNVTNYSTPQNNAEFNDELYIMYTSGTTGKPKGVRIQHRALTNWAAYLKETYSITPSDKIYVTAPFTFDCAWWELFCLCLCQGAQAVMTTDSSRIDIEYLTKLFNDLKVTITTLTPSLLRLLNPKDFPSLKVIFTTGEELLQSYIQPWLTAEKLIINAYGPTESGIGVSLGDISLNEFDKVSDQNLIPEQHVVKPHIGKPICNAITVILNPQHLLVPIGTMGEIYVGGKGLSLGYDSNELINQKFIPVVINNKITQLFRTGDKGRLNSDGNIEFYGRIGYDNQVKINGVRIELNNITEELLKYPGIFEASTLFNKQDKNSFIIAFIVLKNPNQHISFNTLYRYLIEKGIPREALQIAFQPVDSLPKTNNSKIDYKMLSQLSLKSIDFEEYIAPESQMQLELVKIYQAILPDVFAKKISMNADFMLDLGGNSVLAMQLKSRVIKKYGYFPDVKKFYKEPTISFLAGYLEEKTQEYNSDSIVFKKR